jgi:hypothetical protein
MLQSNVDRDARERVADSIERFVHEETTAFAFAEAVDDISRNSHDPAVQWVAALVAAEFAGDDFETGDKIEVTKYGWDYLQRLLVLFRSDFDFIAESRWHWSITQLIAAACVGVFAISKLRFGNGPELLGINAVLGIVSMLVAWFRIRRTRWWPAPDKATEPFDNTADLLTVRRTLVGFRKTRYPSHLRIRRPAHASAESSVVANLFIGGVWLILAPVPLFGQMFPYREERIRVVVQPELVLDEG